MREGARVSPAEDGRPLGLALGLALALALPPGLFAASVVEAPPPGAPAPPSMAAFAIAVSGARMNGLVYRAAGEGPHPVALFLHGFPGNEKNLDLAQAARRAGWDVVYFDYRGSWGSGGTFSFAGALEDVAAALAWIRAPANAAEHHFDPDRIAIVGHSFGGWLALLTAGQEPADVCVAAIAAWNIGWDARRLVEAPDERAPAAEGLRDVTDPAGGPIRSTAEALLGEIVASPPEWDYLSGAEALTDRPLLLVAATRDTPDEGPAMHAKLAATVRAAGGGGVRSVTFEDDHAFSASRLPLAELVVEWLDGDCATRQEEAAMDRARLEDFASRYAAAWSGGDPEALASFYVEGGSLAVNDGAPSVGRAAIAATAGGYMLAFPDMEVRMDSVRREGGRATFHWTWTGTNSGPGGTGRSVRISGYEEWRLDADGLILESKGHFDEAEYRRQVDGGNGAVDEEERR